VQAGFWGKVGHEAKKVAPDAALLDISQDLLNEQILRARERKPEKQNPQPEKKQTDKNDPSNSMSFKFSQTLSYASIDEGGGGSGS
jgi:hypothetical protein